MIYESGGAACRGRALRAAAAAHRRRCRPRTAGDGPHPSEHFGDNADLLRDRLAFRTVPFEARPDRESDMGLARAVERFPFVPNDDAKLNELCFEAYNIQSHGLRKRMESARVEKIVIGVSGGLDSTQALVVAAHTFDALGLPRKNILAYTLPSFATSKATKLNAWRLMNALGVTAQEIDMTPALSADADRHRPPLRRRRAGLTTSPSKTFSGSSHLCAVPPRQQEQWDRAGHGRPVGAGSRLVHLWRRRPHVPLQCQRVGLEDADPAPDPVVAQSERFGPDASAAMLDILATEISPELVPGESEDGPSQKTEDFVGPYALQDFNLYYITRFGFRPSKVAFLSHHAWGDAERGGWPPNIEPR